LTLLHTADAHVDYFAALVGQMAQDIDLHQEVHAPWLARAQQGDATLKADIANTMAAHKDAPVSTVVLAQVSMAGAAPMLADLGVPVISAPQAALDRLRPAAP